MRGLAIIVQYINYMANQASRSQDLRRPANTEARLTDTESRNTVLRTERPLTRRDEFPLPVASLLFL
jgi:hypothetical protein